MVNFPNGKINLGLNIISKRTDGFHNLETIFYPIPYRDVLEIIRAPATATNDLFQTTGLPILGNTEDNLCLKAVRILRKDFPLLPYLQLHLHKIIPMQAGLGGGSADGAFTLSLINKQFQLGLSAEKLEHYALELGSDCPFFIHNTPAYASGRGEILQPIDFQLSGYQLILVHPTLAISTKEAFKGIIPGAPPMNLFQAIRLPVESWPSYIHNDFERSVLQLYPELAQIKTALYAHGAVYASLTGTGSTVYGLFNNKASIPSFPNAISFPL